jgi:hypothetical protein
MNTLGELAAVVVALIGAVASLRFVSRRHRERRLERECIAILRRYPRGVGLVLPIRPEELDAARWGERQGWIGVRQSSEGSWSVFRKHGSPV